MYVVCLEGCHGVGKSTLLSVLEKRGFTTLDEAFLDQPKYALHPQTLTMEVVWVSNWFMRLLKLKHDLEIEGKTTNTIFFADRSPYSAVFYSKSSYSNHLEGVIRGQIEELSRMANIHVVTVRLSADRDIIWHRITERLKVEPERKKFNENKREWMEETMNWYDSFHWDITVDNGTISSEQCAPELVNHLCSSFPSFSTSLPELALKAITPKNEDDTTSEEGLQSETMISCSDSSSLVFTPQNNLILTPTSQAHVSLSQVPFSKNPVQKRGEYLNGKCIIHNEINSSIIVENGNNSPTATKTMVSKEGNDSL